VTALSPETRRLLQLSRGGDDPAPAREQAVRNRLIAQLGVTALAGIATGSTASAAVGAAEAASAASASVLSGAAPASTAVGSAAVNAASAGAATASLAKTVAGVVLLAGLGAGAWKNDQVVEETVAWSTAVAVEAERAAKRVWLFVTGGSESAASRGQPAAPALDPSVLAANRHELLIAIARRPNRPVAKEAELVLILGAQQALAAGDDERAARYLDQHEAQFAGGELSENREALRVRIHDARGRGKAQPTAPSPATPSNADKTNF